MARRCRLAPNSVVSSDKFVWRDLVPLVDRIIKIVETREWLKKTQLTGLS